MSLKTDLAAEVRKAHANGGNWDDVAAALKISKQYATQLATQSRNDLRKAGHSQESIDEMLPKFRRGKNETGSANDIAAAYAAEKAAALAAEQASQAVE